MITVQSRLYTPDQIETYAETALEWIHNPGSDLTVEVSQAIRLLSLWAICNKNTTFEEKLESDPPKFFNPAQFRILASEKMGYEVESEISKKIFTMAWESAHQSGYPAVWEEMNRLKELVDITVENTDYMEGTSINYGEIY